MGGTHCHEFAFLRIDLINLPVAGCDEILVFEQTLHFGNAALSRIYHSSCGFLVLALGAFTSEAELAAGCLLAGNGSVVSRLCFVALLLGNHALAEERLHAVVGLFCDV